MRRILRSVVAVAVIATPVWAFTRDGLETIEPETAKQFGKILSDQADKFEKPQIKIAPDPDKANGVHVPHKVGTLIVPQKGLEIGEELHAKFKEEKGAPLAYLFLYHLAPVLNGSPAEGNRMREVKISDDNGQSHTVNALLLSVRLVGDDDYRLYAFGHDSKPLFEAKFSEGTGPGPEPVAVEIKEVNEATMQGKMVVTVFGKYQASFPVGHRPE